MKLSRSLGNQLLLRDLAGLVDGAGSGEVVRGFRYFVATNHYRTTLNFTEAALGGAVGARRRLNRLYRRLRSTAEMRRRSPSAHGPSPLRRPGRASSNIWMTI